MTDNQPAPEGAEADTVRITVDPDTDLVRDAVADATFYQYLRRAHEGTVTVGDTWAEFVSAGCGSQTSVSIRVVAVEGGACVGPGTEFTLD